ncbi:hypothetical protein [Micrococcus sp.]|uniref:VG15 protein n=1 Tax=Micrococcus sp. TaxID=1271 RepID=UPI002A9144CD|nr:hypothetical protein [Micrococcus sp.]MDY6054352.1 hypothetical protein [Micrococcus sp.]
MRVPAPAVEQYERSVRLQRSARAAVDAVWRQLDSRFLSESWDEAAPTLTAAVTRLQGQAATGGARYGAPTLAAQGVYVAPGAWVDPGGIAGWSSRGVPVERALYSGVPHTKRLIAGGMEPRAAMRQGREMVRMSAATQVADAGRTAASVDTFTRRGIAYVRMLTPPSCGRCAVLAGRVYMNNEGFRRHPRCDCIHVPTSRAAAEREGLVTDPYEYFESLSEAEQAKAFGVNGAQAIRDGADLFQVVNAGRGLSYGGESRDGTLRGQKVASPYTRESTSRRGLWGGTRGIGRQRLSVDAIYKQKLDRETTLRLLERNGYLLPQGQVPEGAIRGQYSLIPKSDMTAAEKRVQTATLRWQAVLEGRNPYGDGPLAPGVAARAEAEYRRWVASGGHIFTR